MINFWWVTRPKRKLNSIPEVLAAFAEISLNQEWQGQRDTHLALEEALEDSNIKRTGERRDQTGGGARTYRAWVASLGLIFTQESTNQLKLTLAGEAIMNGESPVAILKNQVLKYQFPSSFSVSRGVDVSRRFKIRPFRFLLRLLMDKEIDHLTEEEIDRLYEKMIKVRIIREGSPAPEETLIGAGCKYVGNGDMYIDLKLYGTIKVNGGAQSISINDRVFMGEIEDITPFSDYVYDIVVKMKEIYNKTAN